jgi:L-fucose mutarotase/ribose pyranase (RbsD/FucU family)
MMGMAAVGLAAALACAAELSWQTKLEQDLPKMGHRNWIVIADSAYPWQSKKGIETVVTGNDQLSVVKTVLAALDKTKHVKPTVFVDAELAKVDEKDAPGIGKYRQDLDALLGKRGVNKIPHEEIIAKLDKAGEVFHVLILKTDMTLPYTSVFLQLDCGYWNAEAEKRLRDVLQGSPGSAHHD